MNPVRVHRQHVPEPAGGGDRPPTRRGQRVRERRPARPGRRARRANAVAIEPELAAHRARQLTPDLEAWADRIVDLNEAGIPDLYGRDEQAYRATAAELEALIRGMM